MPRATNVRKVRSTGTIVSLWRPGEQCAKEDGWMLVCEDHGGVLNGSNSTDLKSFWSHPEEWCPTCLENEQHKWVKSPKF